MSVTILAVSFLATLLSAMSGAGSAMVTVPTWILLGYSLPSALTASQINGALWTPVAARNYLRKKPLDRRLIGGLIGFGLVGAFLGTQVVVNTDSEILQRAVGFVILGLVVFAFFQKAFGLEAASPTMSRSAASWLALPLGFYEAVFGSGNGIFTSAVLVKARGFDLVTALGYYYLISFTWCLLASALYLRGGFGNWRLIFFSSIGAIVGAHVGSTIGRTRGSPFVRICFLVLGSVLGGKLAFGF